MLLLKDSERGFPSVFPFEWLQRGLLLFGGNRRQLRGTILGTVLRDSLVTARGISHDENPF